VRLLARCNRKYASIFSGLFLTINSTSKQKTKQKQNKKQKTKTKQKQNKKQKIQNKKQKTKNKKQKTKIKTNIKINIMSFPYDHSIEVDCDNPNIQYTNDSEELNEVDEWNLQDWLQFLNLPLNTDPHTQYKQIVDLINKKLKNYQNQEDDSCYKILMRAKEFFNRQATLAYSTFQSQYADQNAQNQITTTNNAAQIQKSLDTPINYTKPLTQGTKNPLLKNIFKKYILLNSNQRTHPLSSSTNNYIIDTSLKNVLSIRLHSIKLPPSWYPFDHSLGNNYFGVSSSTSSITDVSCIEIEPGYYDASGLILAINTELSTSGIDASFSYNATNNKVSLTPATTDLSFIFYDEDMLICDSSACHSTSIYSSKANSNLGYFLGFRNTAQGAGAGLNNLIIQIQAGASTTQAQAQLNLNRHINAIVCVDEYNNNTFGEKILLLESKNKTLALPSYYDRDISCNLLNSNNSNNSNTFIPLASNPRTLTQAQLFTLDKIMNQTQNNNNSNNNLLINKSLQNSLGLVQLEAGEYVAKTLFTDNTSPKVYLGPVDIERLRVQILDANGYILNLNFTDWECVLEIEQMYQL
jgi:hypothetical protein